MAFLRYFEYKNYFWSNSCYHTGDLCVTTFKETDDC